MTRVIVGLIAIVIVLAILFVVWGIIDEVAEDYSWRSYGVAAAKVVLCIAAAVGLCYGAGSVLVWVGILRGDL